MNELTDKNKVFRLVEDEFGEIDTYEFLAEGPFVDIDGVTYTKVGDFLQDEDFYQGLNMVTVIRHPDGTEYGYPWWDDISKHGESYIDTNMYEFGFRYDEVNDEEMFFVWTEVEPYTIKAYRFND